MLLNICLLCFIVAFWLITGRSLQLLFLGKFLEPDTLLKVYFFVTVFFGGLYLILTILTGQ